MFKFGIICNFIEDDLKQYIKLFKLTTDDKSNESIIQQIKEVESNPNVTVMFVENDDEKIIGQITFKYIDFSKSPIKHEKYVLIESLSVEKKYRHIGVGQTLLERGIPEILLLHPDIEYILTVTRINSSGKNLCKKMGFDVKKQTSHRFYQMIKKVK